MKLVVPSTETTVAAEQTQTLVELDRRTASVQSAVTQFTDPPLFVANAATAQSIPSQANTEVTFGSVQIDTHGGAVDSAGYTVQVAGIYVVQAMVPVATGSKVATWLRLDGTDIEGSGSNITGSVSDVFGPTAAVPVMCGVGQRLSVVVWQAAASAVNTFYGAGANYNAVFICRWIRPIGAAASA